jgi:hypothetical protein
MMSNYGCRFFLVSEFEEMEDGKKAREIEAVAFSELYSKVKEALGNLHAGLTM